MTIEAYNAVAFMRLTAISLRRYPIQDITGRTLGMIADKLDAEAKDLEASLAPKEEKDAKDR